MGTRLIRCTRRAALFEVPFLHLLAGRHYYVFKLERIMLNSYYEAYLKDEKDYEAIG